MDNKEELAEILQARCNSIDNEECSRLDCNNCLAGAAIDAGYHRHPEQTDLSKGELSSNIRYILDMKSSQRCGTERCTKYTGCNSCLTDQILALIPAQQDRVEVVAKIISDFIAEWGIPGQYPTMIPARSILEPELKVLERSVAEKDAEIERLKGEMHKLDMRLAVAVSPDDAREAIASERERIAGEIATMLDIHEDDTYCRISNHVQYSEFEARYIKREEGR